MISSALSERPQNVLRFGMHKLVESKAFLNEVNDSKSGYNSLILWLSVAFFNFNAAVEDLSVLLCLNDFRLFLSPK